MNPMAMRLVQLLKGTAAEHALEPAVAALGLPYRVQFPCWIYEGGLRYFPDFLLPTLNLVIEVDDASHKKKTEDDHERTQALYLTHGWKVVRCSNEDALVRPYATVERLTGLKCRMPEEPVQLNLPRLAKPRGKSSVKKDRSAAVVSAVIKPPRRTKGKTCLSY